MRQLPIVRAVRLGIKNLSLHALRSLLTMLGLVFGVGSVIAMLSVGEGASREALDQIKKLGSNNIIISAKKPTEEQTSGTQMVRLSIYGLTYEDDQRLRETMSAVKCTVPAKEVLREGRVGEQRQDLRVVGTTPDWFRLVKRPVLAGRVLTQTDLDSRSAVCILTESGARKLTATQYAIGQPISIGGNVFTVEGIVVNETGVSSSGIAIPDQSIDAYVPLTAAIDYYGDYNVQRTEGAEVRERVQLRTILVEVDESEHVEPTAKAIEAMLKANHKKVDYKIDVPLALLRQAEATKKMFNIVLGSIAGISLLVGGIGIMNIMLATVTERTREIGIRRAIGARQGQIVLQFLIETVVLSSLGGVIGIVMGVVVPYGITWATHMPTLITPWSIALSLGISVGVGILFGLYPAYRASRLDPIEALRHE